MDLPSQLSYTGSVDPTHGFFYYRDNHGVMKPIPISRLSVKGSKSSQSEGYKNNSTIKDVEPQFLAYGNPLIIESCNTPLSAKEVFLDFSLNISSNVLKPRVCHCGLLNNALINLTRRYAELGGFHELARRLAKNLLSATWLFRNRKYCPQIEITTTTGLNVTLEDVNQLAWDEKEWQDQAVKILDVLTEEIAEAYTNNKINWFADITSTLNVRSASKLFPSQILDKKSKILFSIDFDGSERTAALRDAKIGAGLAMIDDWYGERDDAHPLRVHEYGADLQSGMALRRPENGNDFYKYLKDTDEHLKVLKSLKNLKDIPHYIHYMVSVLIKGGVFVGGKE